MSFSLVCALLDSSGCSLAGVSGLSVAVAWSSQQMAVEKCCKEAANASEPEQPEREGLGPSTRCFYLQQHSLRTRRRRRRKPNQAARQVQAPHLGEGGAFCLLLIPLYHFWSQFTCVFFFFINFNLSELRLQYFFGGSCKLIFFGQLSSYLPSGQKMSLLISHWCLSLRISFRTTASEDLSSILLEGKVLFVCVGGVCFGSSYQLCVNVHAPFLWSLY